MTNEIFKIIDNSRIEKKLSIANICRKADVSYQSWACLKKGNYSLNTLSKFCNTLEIKEILIKFN